MESRAGFSSVDVVHALVQCSCQGVNAVGGENTHQGPASVHTRSDRELAVICWSPRKSMGTAPAEVPIVGDLLRMRSMAETGVATVSNHTSGGPQQLVHRTLSSKWIGVVRFPTGRVLGEAAASAPYTPRVAKVSASTHYLSTHVPVPSDRYSPANHDTVLAYAFALQRKKIICWLLQRLAALSCTRSASGRPSIPVDTVASAFPSLLLVNQSDRHALLEQAIDRYARGVLSLFDSSVISLVHLADAADFCVLSPAEARVSLSLDLALGSLAALACGRHLAEICGSIEIVHARLLVGHTKRINAALLPLVEAFSATLQLVAPLLSMNVKRETPWLMAVVRFLFALVTYADSALVALLASRLVKKHSLPLDVSTSALDTDVWLACVTVSTHRKVLGRPPHSGSGEGRGGGSSTDVSQDALPSVVLGNQASAFFSVLPEPRDDDTDDIAPDADRVVPVEFREAPLSSKGRDRSAGCSTATVTIHSGSLRCITATASNDDHREAHLTATGAANSCDAAQSAERSLDFFSTVCDRWPKIGPLLSSTAKHLCRTEAGHDGGQLVLPVGARRGTRKSSATTREG